MTDTRQKEALSFTDVVAATIVLFEEQLKLRKIALRVDVDLGQMIFAHPGELVQVLSNMIMNSIDAVASLEDRWIRIAGNVAGGKVRLTVTDSEAGIQEELRQKILQPFFSTEETGKGQGLGLSICEGITREHGAPSTTTTPLLTRRS
jgi:two-component system sensor histidine kinase DctS